MHTCSRWLLLSLLAIAGQFTSQTLVAEPPADNPVAAINFNRDIQPLLSNHCYLCHGPDEGHRKAELRFDLRDSALESAAFVPGKPDESELVARIFSDDPELLMPPAKLNKPLTAAQKEKLRQWIAAGAEYQTHWAFVPAQRATLPAVKNAGWRRNAIDDFILSRLEQEGLTASPEADRETLIRRVTLDLTGLPPSPEEVAAFRDDARPDAYEQLVDRLLATTAYGERMAWDWMESSRYADSNGYQGDNERTMWPWRDWVVRAFNENLPYDQFTAWQLAGDLLPNASFDQKLATGFCRNHPINGEGGRIAEENRVDYVMDMTETMGTVWLGLTLNCARCHDHKFDPLARRDYYRLFAFFNQTPVDGGGRSPQTPPLLEVKPSSERPNWPLAQVMVMEDQAERRATHMLEKGVYSQLGEQVTAATPASLQSLPADAPQNRLGLAQWITDPDNPLTARVTVNRFWQMLFGMGFVKTADDFGMQGEYPSHPQLLDWLAVEFRESGWNVKHLLRLMVTSAAYRQASRVNTALLERDPENRLLARGPRYRMPSWMLRDQALAAAGLLVNKPGGPPVNPYQPGGVWEEATFGNKRYQQDHGEALYRRSLYTFWRRIIGPTMFFDTPSRTVCAVKPTRTNTPLHALATLNDTTYVEAARAMAERVLRREQEIDERLDVAFRLVLVRQPTSEERAVLRAGLDRVRTAFAAQPEEAKRLLAVGESRRDESLDAVEHAAWTATCLSILNLDEAMNKE